MYKNINLEIGRKTKKISDEEFYTIYNEALPKQLFPINPTWSPN